MKKIISVTQVLNIIFAVYLFIIATIVLYNADGEGAAGYSIGILSFLMLVNLVLARYLNRERKNLPLPSYINIWIAIAYSFLINFSILSFSILMIMIST